MMQKLVWLARQTACWGNDVHELVKPSSTAWGAALVALTRKGLERRAVKPIGVLALAAWLSAPMACSTDDARPAPAGSGGSGAAPSASAGEGSSEVNGGASEGPNAEGGADALGGAGSDLPPIGMLGGLGPVAGGGAPSAGPSECDSEQEWGDGVSLSTVSTPGADERLLALTHDELSIVFSRDDTPMVADRTDADRDFGEPVVLTLPAGYTHEHGLALSPDGRALVVVSVDRFKLAQVSRSSRGGAFDGAVDESRFAYINANNQSVHAYLSSPVLSRSGSTLFLTQIAGESSRVYRAEGEGIFSLREMSEDTVTLGSDDADAKLTLSVSSDLRTLFVLDEALGHVTGLWSSALGSPYTHATQFSELEGAFTSDGCGRLYGTRSVDDSLDVVVHTPN
jgi:hypothetical protein